jgi:hypothetical protein
VNKLIEMTNEKSESHLQKKDEYSPMISVGFPSQVDITIGLQNPGEL